MSRQAMVWPAPARAPEGRRKRRRGDLGATVWRSVTDAGPGPVNTSSRSLTETRRRLRGGCVLSSDSEWRAGQTAALPLSGPEPRDRASAASIRGRTLQAQSLWLNFESISSRQWSCVSPLTVKQHNARLIEACSCRLLAKYQFCHLIFVNCFIVRLIIIITNNVKFHIIPFIQCLK